MIDYELLKKLCTANGISGDENSVRGIILDEIKQYEQLFDIQTLVSKNHQIIYQSSSLEVKTY